MTATFLHVGCDSSIQDVGLYVHVPFCRVKCGYCDFYSRAGGPEEFEPLVEVLLAEMDSAVTRRGVRVETIFVGGGTPTVLPLPLLRRLLGRLGEVARRTVGPDGCGKGFPHQRSTNQGEPARPRAGGPPGRGRPGSPGPECGKGFPHQQLGFPHQRTSRKWARLDGVVEFTVEANPATVDEAKAELLAACGVDRVSMGAQSFDDGELAVLGREHKPADVAATLDILRRAGVTRYNLDLIFGVPGQTLDSWQRSLRTAIDLDPEHISCYGLTYELGTPLYQRRQLGEVMPLDEDLEAQMYLATMDVLAAAGYKQYEISNYARPGCECRHNLRYWHNRPGIGIGPAAASYFAGRRWRNVPDTGEYVRLIRQGASSEIDAEELTPLDRAGETAMLNLRLIEGIQRESFQQDTGFDPFELFAEVIPPHVAAGLLVADSERIALTRQGRLVADAVIADFLRPHGRD